MVILSQVDKERAVCEKVAYYTEHGFMKSEAVRKVMVDFAYTTEAAIYGICGGIKKKQWLIMPLMSHLKVAIQSKKQRLSLA